MRWFAVLLFVIASAAPAQILPEYKRTTINDYADLLPADAEEALHRRLETFQANTGVELTVLTLKSQKDYPTPPELYPPVESIEDFATAIFDFWGIGNASRNDGILVLVLSQDRAMRIELGAGYGRDWDRVAADVIDRSFLPSFAEGDYATGITTGVEDVITSIARPFQDGSDAPSSGGGIGNLMVFAAIAGTIVLFARQTLGDLLTRFRRCPVCGSRALSRTRKTLRRATRTSPGSGEVTTRCSQCSYRDVQTYLISRITSSSSSSGFGGGRSGGGGATGRW